MKHKSTHLTWLIVCILVAAGTFMMGIFYGEKVERKRIQEGFVRIFQEQFGNKMGTGNNLSGAQSSGAQQ